MDTKDGALAASEAGVGAAGVQMKHLKFQATWETHPGASIPSPLMGAISGGTLSSLWDFLLWVFGWPEI